MTVVGTVCGLATGSALAEAYVFGANETTTSNLVFGAQSTLSVADGATGIGLPGAGVSLSRQARADGVTEIWAEVVPPAFMLIFR